MGILLTGRRISAAQALEYGLVNEVVPDEALDAAVDAWVEDVVACAPPQPARPSSARSTTPRT